MFLESDLEILACPACKGDLQLLDATKLSCLACNLQFPINDGVPVLFVAEKT